MIDVQAYQRDLRYLRGGREPPAVDCWGLVCLIYRDAFRIELDPHDTAPMALAAVVGAIAAESETWLPVERAAIRPGDLVFMRRIGRPFHVGVVLDGRSMIHADDRVNVCVEPLDRQQGRIEFYRHPALRDHPQP